MSNEQSIFLQTHRWSVELERAEIVVEHKCPRVVRVSVIAGSFVARTEIASGVVTLEHRLMCLFDLPEPGAFRPMRRDKDPFACEGVPPSMGMFFQIEQFHTGTFSRCNNHHFEYTSISNLAMMESQM